MTAGFFVVNTSYAQAATISISGITGSGSVVSSPPGINCSTTGGAQCSAGFTNGTDVTLTAVPAVGYLFDIWNDYSDTLCPWDPTCLLPQVDTDHTNITVSFVPAYLVTINVTGPGSVVAAADGNQNPMNCTTVCSRYFKVGSQMMFGPTANSGAVFSSWSDACSGNASCIFQLFADQTVGAIFVDRNITSPPLAPIVTTYANSQLLIHITLTLQSDNAAGFRLERSASQTGPWSLVQDDVIDPNIWNMYSPVNAYDNCGYPEIPPSDAGCYYRAYTYNSMGNSPYSNIMWGQVAPDMPPNPNAPPAPTNLTAKRISPTEVQLSWRNDPLFIADGNIIEQSTSPTSGFIPVFYAGMEYPLSTTNTLFPVKNLTSNSIYYFRVKAMSNNYLHEYGKSAPSNVVTVTTLPATNIKPPINKNWLFVITNEGTPLTSDAVNFLCDTSAGALQSSLNSWVGKEANKYSAAKPFSGISCFGQQITLPNSLFNGRVTINGTNYKIPLNQNSVMNYLEANYPAIASAGFVSILHYNSRSNGLWTFYPDNSVGIKYNFFYYSQYPADSYNPPPWTPFIPYGLPDFTIDSFGSSLMRDLLKNIGATDKIWTGTTGPPYQACNIDASTGMQYPGFDVMCGVTGRPNASPFAPDLGYEDIPLANTIVSDATAKEIGWTYHPADTSVNWWEVGDSEVLSYLASWRAGNVTDTYVLNGLAMWRAGGYHYDSSLASCIAGSICWAIGR